MRPRAAKGTGKSSSRRLWTDKTGRVSHVFPLTPDFSRFLSFSPRRQTLCLPELFFLFANKLLENLIMVML
jgi:hypothetical protein